MFKGVKSALYRRRDWLGKYTLLDILLTVVSIVGFVVVWEILALIIDNPYLPTPVMVANAFIHSFQFRDPVSGYTMWTNIQSSLNRFIQGFAIAIILAVPLGLLIGYSRIGNALVTPVIEMMRPIPPIAWVPFLFVVLGAIWGPIITIFIGVFFPVISNVVFGVRSVDPPLIDAAKTLGAKRSTLFAKVIFPYTIPYLMAGVTIGLGIGWMCIVAAEMIGVQGGGVGSYILNMSNIGAYPEMFAGMTVIAILGISTVGGASYIQRKLSKWMGVSRK